MKRRRSSHFRPQPPLNLLHWGRVIALLVLVVDFGPSASNAQGVRINEIMYAPGSSEPEWIELYNRDSSIVDIAGWSLSSRAGNVTLPTSLQTADQFSQFIVITTDSAALRARRPGKYLLVQCPLPQFNPANDAIVLRDASLATIDSVPYWNTWGGMGGASLERISAFGSSTDSANWGNSIAPTGATPGAENSLSFPAIRDLALDSLSDTILSDSLQLGVRIENRGNRTLDSSILTVSSDSGTGATTLYSETIATLDADSAITLRLSFPFVAYRPVNYSVFIENPQDTIHADDTLRFTLPGRTRPLSVIINEIMFAPISPEPEWIELWNTTSDTVIISGWSVSVKGHATTLPDSNSVIAPDSMVILSINANVLSARRGIPTRRIITLALPALVNTGSSLALKDARGTLIDSAIYNGSSTKGISLERVDPTKLGYDTSNWAASLDSTGSTILRPNSVRKRPHDLALLSAEYWNDSLFVLLRNDGNDTALDPAIGVRIDTIDTARYATDASILPDSTAEFLIPLPNDFFGIFHACVYLVDSLDEQHANDTARLSLRRPVPADSLVINEIMFEPLPAGCQWFEVFNRSQRMISLDSVKLVTGEKRPSEYSHTIPPRVVAPASFGVIVADSSLFYPAYPSLRGKSGVAYQGISTLDLGRDSCFMVLRNFDTSRIDSVHYFKSWQHSIVRKTFAGISLERIAPSGPSNTADNWQASLDSSGATPLAPNSALGNVPHDTILPAGTSFAAKFEPNPFSPEYGGAENTSSLTIQTGDATSTWELRVRLFDPHGRMVRLLSDAAPIIGGTVLTFDGRRDDGQFLPPGVYAALIELSSQNPIRTMSKTVGIVIAGKRR